MTLRFRSHVALTSDVRSALVDRLNNTLAGVLDLSSQLKQAHWSVRGEGFYASHRFFDELHARAIGWADQVAERIAQLGGRADGTVRSAAARSPLAEHDVNAILPLDHVRSLTTQYALLGALLRGQIGGHDAAAEPVTIDLCTEILRALERDLWMLESQLERGLVREHERSTLEAGVAPHAPSDPGRPTHLAGNIVG